MPKFVEVPTEDWLETVKDAARYRRLQILGCAPMGSPHLDTGCVLRFSGLDKYVDEDMRVHPSRGEHKRTTR